MSFERFMIGEYCIRTRGNLPIYVIRLRENCEIRKKTRIKSQKDKKGKI